MDFAGKLESLGYRLYEEPLRELREEFQESYDMVLPEALGDFLEQYDSSQRVCLEYGEAELAPIEYFLSLTENEDDIVMWLENYSERMPEEFFPIAVCAGGNLLCLRLPGTAEEPEACDGEIWYWNHAKELAVLQTQAEQGEQSTHDYWEYLSKTAQDYWENMQLVSPSFEELVMKLAPCEEARREAFIPVPGSAVLYFEKEHQLLETFCEETEKRVIKLRVDEDREPSLTDSKFGGLPYWDFAKRDYPCDGEGKPLNLLAQFNLSEMNEQGINVDDLLPRKGILQFFIAASDDCYGADFGEAEDGYCVIWHEEINPAVTAEEVRSHGIVEASDEDCSPLYGEFAVTPYLAWSSMTVDDYRFEKTMHELAARFGMKLPEGEKVFKLLSDKAGSDLSERSDAGHNLLGYPYFTQGDPRDYGEDGDEDEMDVLLFQMDSDSDEDREYVMWGDCGVASFFINSEKLKQRDFSDVFYTWDCC